MSKSFNIFNIRNMTHQPSHLKIQAFIHISEEIKKLIRNRASQGFYEMNYQIPSFILGYPPYNIIDCASYQYHEFIKEHFEVNLGKLNDKLYLNISWKKPPPNQQEYENSLKKNKNKSSEKSVTLNSEHNKNTYKAINNSMNTIPSLKKKKKSNDNENTKTMNFFHSSGFVDTLPINTAKTSIYL